jgi:hypothetical protein
MGVKQFGRAKRKPKNKRYWAENHRFANKVKRIRKSEGEDAVRRYTARYREGR